MRGNNVYLRSNDFVFLYVYRTTGLHRREKAKNMAEKWIYKDITQEVISTAMEGHRELGAGFLEYVCELLNFSKKSREVKRRIS